MDIIDSIIGRCSVRNYKKHSLDKTLYQELIGAAIMAPSGKNTQPWKFRVVTDSLEKTKISALSVHGKWMSNADGYILVFLDENLSYDYTKSVLSCGAAIQNILLAAYGRKLGSCWVGDVIDKSEQIKKYLNISKNSCTLMGLITIGNCEWPQRKASRRSLAGFFI